MTLPWVSDGMYRGRNSSCPLALQLSYHWKVNGAECLPDPRRHGENTGITVSPLKLRAGGRLIGRWHLFSAGPAAWALQCLLWCSSCSPMACFLSGRSSFVSPGPDGTVTLNFNFPGCTTVCQPLFWHSNLHLHSSSQMNTLALVKTRIPLSSFPSSLLSKRGFLHSLALLLNCYLVARRCCYCMCEYGKWMA